MVAHIQAITAAYYGVAVREMTSAAKEWRIARPRQIAMYLAHELTPKSLPDIGRRFGRDHSTVWFAIKQVQRRMIEDAEVAEDVRVLRDHLLSVPKENRHRATFVLLSDQPAVWA